VPLQVDHRGGRRVHQLCFSFAVGRTGSEPSTSQ
jgi:hypothetical protein